MGQNVCIVMYHYVRPIAGSRYEGVRGLEYELFRQQLEFFRANFNFVSCADIRAAIYENRPLPDKAMLLTFDDGYIDHYAYAFPLLHQFGISGFFSMPGRILAERKLLDVNKIHFVLASLSTDKIIAELRTRLEYYRGREFSFGAFEELYAKLAKANRFDTADTIFIKRLLQTELPERLRNILADELFKLAVPVKESAFVNELYMSMEQIETMVRCGMEFGIHGYDHKWLGNLPEDEMMQDVDKAISFFTGVLPDDWTMCFPYGSANAAALRHATMRGARLGLSTEVRQADIRVDNPMFLPRLDTNDFPPKSENFRKYDRADLAADKAREHRSS